MPAICFTCEEPGHVAANCPNQEALDTRPRWCGFCDPRTRLVAVNRDQTQLVRCQNCHPAPRKPLVQHKRCPGCRMIIHEWDTAACGQHSVPGAVKAVRGPVGSAPAAPGSPPPEHRSEHGGAA